MEAIVELLVAIVIGVVECALAVAWLAIELLGMLLEFVLLVALRGLRPASERLRQRRACLRQKKEKQAEDKASKQAALASPRRRFLIAVLLLAAIVSVAATAYFREQRRQQRIEATKLQIDTLADRFLNQLRDKKPLPHEGQLAQTDAWKQPLELFVDEALAGTMVVVRSRGADEVPGTVDDLLAVRIRAASAKEFRGELAKRAVDALKERVKGMLRGAEDVK